MSSKTQVITIVWLTFLERGALPGGHDLDEILVAARDSNNEAKIGVAAEILPGCGE